MERSPPVQFTPQPLFAKRIEENIHSVSTYNTYLLNEIRIMQKKECFTDFELTLNDGTTVACHRLILAGASRFFNTVLLSGMKESVDRKMALPSIDAQCARSLIDYMYTGSILVEWSDMHKMVEACHFLQLEQLKRDCEEHILRQMPTEETPMWYDIGITYQLPKVVDRCEKLLFKHIEIQEYDFFKQIHFDKFIKIVSRDDLETACEDNILKGILSWIQYDKANRLQYALELLKNVRLSFCNEQCLPAILSSLEAQEYPSEVTDFLTNALINKNDLPRHCYTERHLLMTCFGSSVKYAAPGPCFQLNASLNKWELLGRCPLGRNGTIEPLSNGFLHVLNCGHHEKMFQLYDTDKKERWNLPSLPFDRCMSIACVSKEVFALGRERHENGVSSTFLKINTVAKENASWEPCRQMFSPVNSPVVAVAGNYIYVLGVLSPQGVVLSSFRLIFYRYDVTTDTWHDLGGPGLSSLGVIIGFVHSYLGKLFYMSDCPTDPFVGLCYDIESDTWERIDSGGSPAASGDGKVICLPHDDELIMLLVEKDQVYKKAFNMITLEWADPLLPFPQNFFSKENFLHMTACTPSHGNYMSPRFNMTIISSSKIQKVIMLLEKLMNGDMIV